ncbi:MAG: ATP-binding protein [Pyrinomonadaceae bacterium]
MNTDLPTQNNDLPRESEQQREILAVQSGARVTKEMALLARELSAATSAPQAYRVTLDSLARLVPAEFLSVTTNDESVGDARQRLRATLARGREFLNTGKGETLRVRHTMLERARQAGVPVSFNDAPAELVSDALLMSLVCPSPQSVLCAPIVLGNALLGFITACAARKQAYTPDDAYRMEAAAHLLAATLARLELSERIASTHGRNAGREQTLVEHLHAISSTATDLSAVMQHAADTLSLALPAISFALLRTVSFSYPKTSLRAWMPHSARPPLEIPVPVGQAERVVFAEHRSMIIEDLRGVERAGNAETNALRTLIERLDARSVCFAPVIYGGHIIASIGLVVSGKEKNYRWTNDDRALLQRAAEIIAPLVVSAQLRESLAAYTEDLLALLRLAGDAVNETEFDRTLHAVLDSWTRIAGTEAAAILRWDEEANQLRLGSATHLPTGALERYTQGVSLDDPLCQMAVQRRAGVVVDLTSDARFAELHNAVRWSSLRGAWATPVIAGTGKLLGMLITFSQIAVEIQPGEQRLADLFARIIAVAMQSLELSRQAGTASQTIRRMEEELQQTAQHKTEFMSVISHELRTPLNAIIGFAEMLRQGFSGELNEQQLEDVRTISESADKLLGMVEDTIDLARVDTERFPIYMDSVAFEEVVRRAVASVRADAETKGLELQLEVSADAPVIRTDPERVRQILTRLLSNAVKFTERGMICVAVNASDGGYVQVSVSDTGVGFDAESFPQAFEEFHQADASNTRRHGGSGLGLAVSKRLVQRLGGHIGVTSRPGEGSTFWFQLPPEIPGTDN